MNGDQESGRNYESIDPALKGEEAELALARSEGYLSPEPERWEEHHVSTGWRDMGDSYIYGFAHRMAAALRDKVFRGRDRPENGMTFTGDPLVQLREELLDALLYLDKVAQRRTEEQEKGVTGLNAHLYRMWTLVRDGAAREPVGRERFEMFGEAWSVTGVYDTGAGAYRLTVRRVA